MKPHDTFLELAAIAMDFPLASAERGRLEQHLAGCAACGRTAHALRGDAMALSNLPPVVLPERRGAEILAVALHPHAVRNPVRLLVVAALLGLLLLGSLAAGAELLRRMDQDDLGIVLPVPSQAASPDVRPGLDNGVGVTWTRADLPAKVPETGGAMMRGVISGGPGAIAWGWAYGLPPTIWTTTDGRAWDPATVEMPTEPDPENPGTISGITAGGPGYVAVGWYDMVGEGRRGLVWTSVDGRTWDLVPHDAAFDHAIIDDVVAWRGELLAYGEEEAGSDEGAGRPLLWTSGDGLAWQREALSTPDGFRASDVVPSREQLWAFGLPASYDINAGWRQTRWLTSTDGRTWSASSLPRYPGPLYPLRDRFLTILQPFPTSGDSAPPDAADRPAPGLYRSTDGSSWERLSQGVSSIEGYDLIEVGGTLVIVGDDGRCGP